MKHTVVIEKIIPGGKGLARTAKGQVIMTPFTLAGENIVASETNQKSGYLEGRIDTILSPSPARIKAFCPLYGECGGCDVQHASYPEQLKIKRNIIAESLIRAKVSLQDVQDTLSSPAQWGYRYRLRLKISPSGQLGFFKKRTNTFLLITSCPLASKGICAALDELNKSGVLNSFAGRYPEVEVLESNKNIILTGI